MNMQSARDVRRIAMQVLYQLDLRGMDDAAVIREGMADGPDEATLCDQGHQLALDAWPMREAADQLASELAPAWPTHRQPPVDRAILRLGYYEMASGRTPIKVAINEAIELAREFSTENSPAFVNGLLDKMAKRLAGEPVSIMTDPAPVQVDHWLSDAMTPDSKI